MTNEQLGTGPQYLGYAALSFVIVGLTAALLPSHRSLFQPFFGNLNPLLVVGAAILLGGLSLRLLQSREWFEVLNGRASLQGVTVSAGFATLLAIAVIIADFFIRYPADMNVAPPQSLLFYPVVGCVVEVVFHVLPLALLLLLLAPLTEGIGAPRLIWLCIVPVALIEPSFQLWLMEAPFSLVGAHTWLQVFAVNIVQLYVFRRYDFVSMYSLRLFYYAYWHIGWGMIRLEVLF